MKLYPCIHILMLYPQRDLLGDRALNIVTFPEEMKVKWGCKVGLTQYDWCSYKKKAPNTRNVHTQSNSHGRTWRKGGPQPERKCFRQNPTLRHLGLAASRAARSAFLCVSRQPSCVSAASRPACCVMTALAYTGLTLVFWQKPKTPFSTEELNKGYEPGSVFTDRQGSWIKYKIPT